ncbi:MAG: hypothetical protein LUE14_03765 [Clostridiales bacterium]|nr:hypothetical protein [Clostridiales bacterium]
MNEVISAEKWQDWIIEMIKGISNVDYLRQIYYFTLVKYDREQNNQKQEVE